MFNSHILPCLLFSGLFYTLTSIEIIRGNFEYYDTLPEEINGKGYLSGHYDGYSQYMWIFQDSFIIHYHLKNIINVKNLSNTLIIFFGQNYFFTFFGCKILQTIALFTMIGSLTIFQKITNYLIQPP